METKDLLQYLGIDPDKAKTLDDFKTSFDTTFVRQSVLNEDHEVIKPIIGKYFHVQEGEIKKLAKVYDVEIDNAEFKELKKISDKVDYVLKKKSELFSSKIAELEAKAGQGNDEKIKELTEKYGKLESKYNDTKGLLDTTKSEYEGYKVTSANEIKGVKLNTLKAKEFSQLKLKATITEIEREGFESIINKKYNFDLDETGNIFVADKQTGKRIESKKTAGTFKTPLEVLNEEGLSAKVIQENQDGGKPAPQPQQQFKGNYQQEQNKQQAYGQRKVADPL